MIPPILLMQIRELDTQMCIEVMHECAGRCGMVDINQAQDALGIKKRAIYNRMNDGKLLHFDIGIHKFPCMNK
jgi:hypothetical protein